MAFSPGTTSEKGHYVVGMPRVARAVRQSIGLLLSKGWLMCSAEFWNHTGTIPGREAGLRAPAARESRGIPSFFWEFAESVGQARCCGRLFPSGCTGAPAAMDLRQALPPCGLYPEWDRPMQSTNPTYLKHAIGVVPAFLLTLARRPPTPRPSTSTTLAVATPGAASQRWRTASSEEERNSPGWWGDVNEWMELKEIKSIT